MAIHFDTKTPKRLLRTLKEGIDAGSIKAWKYDEQGDFSLAGESSWEQEGWLRPKIITDERLSFFLLGINDLEMSTEAYARYHSKMADTLLEHCDRIFTYCRISALSEDGDII